MNCRAYRGLALALCIAAAGRLAAAGSTESINVLSRAMDRAFAAVVALPAGYAAGTNRYPTLYLLHGAGCDESTWGAIADLGRLADEHARIVVCPTAGSHSWYADAGANRAETFIVGELLPHVDMRYRTTGDTNRWIVGFSMGGYGALRLGLRHPGRFAAAGGICPGLAVSRWGSQWGLSRALGPADRRGGFDLFTPAQVAALAAVPPPLIALSCGTEDFFFAENQAAHAALDKAGVRHLWFPHPGQHAEGMAEALRRHLDYFRATSAPRPASRGSGRRRGCVDATGRRVRRIRSPGRR